MSDVDCDGPAMLESTVDVDKDVSLHAVRLVLQHGEKLDLCF